MTLLEEGQIKIHTENIFPIIKKAVYSDHEIFLRELISNGVDAIKKRRMAAFAGDCKESEEAKINIKINKESKTLTISDNGIGMTSDEIKKYINQVAFSSAEEFLEKYKNNNENFIGHFGLGFYSSFMVAKNVEINTKSAYLESDSINWACDGSPNFTLKNSNKTEIGTDIVLHLMEEELEYLEPSRIKTLITKYCDFMPVDVCLEGELINKKDPLWKKNPNELNDEDYINLYKYLYPFQGDPLLWIHLNTDYPYSLQGILYFPKTTGRIDWEQGEIKLYCNQVFVSDSIKEIVPRFLLPLRGVIDSPDIPLNVSRSALQTDRRVRSIGSFISKKIADKLKYIKNEDKSFYSEIWTSISPFIKIGAMEDEKFSEQVEKLILFESSIEIKPEKVNKDSLIEIYSSNEKNFTTISGYLSRVKDNEKRIIYCTDEISQSNALNLWTKQGTEVITADTVIDTQFIPWLESKNKDISFMRVDSELDKSLNDDNPEIADKDGETASEKLRQIIKSSIKNDKVTIQIQALKGENSPPAMILLPEQMRRINDMGALMEQRLPGLPENHVLLINKNHPIVKGLLKLKSTQIITDSNNSSKELDLSVEISTHIYDMAKLSVGGLSSNQISDFQSRNALLMGRLMDKAI
tara:strand:+ start:1156 stop:3069 length:1914 start_codon:yes stop_codon:yes gene_type:complete